MIYIRACRLILITLISLCFVLTVSNLVSANVWLARWTDQLKTPLSNQTTVDSNQMVNMVIYATISILQGNCSEQHIAVIFKQVNCPI